MNSLNYLSVNFYAKLKDKKSSVILNELHKFVNTTFNELIEKIKDLSEIAIAVQDFISKLVNEFARLWQVEFPNSRNAYLEICDGFENLIMKSLYTQILSIIGEDNKLEKLYRKYSFLNLKHFGIEE